MPIDPTSLSGKQLWLRGKDLGALGSTITGWTDQSGLGNNATVSSGTPKVDASLPIFAATDNTHYGPAGGDGGANFAIDGSTGTYWTTNGVAAGWMRLQLGAASVVASYTIRRRDDIPARNPKTWTFEGSNDGTTFTTLDTQTNVTWPTASETKTFNFSNSTAYLYYRLNVTANGGDAYTSVSEIALIGTDKGMAVSGAIVGVPADAAGGSDRELWVVVKSGTPTGGSGEKAWSLGNSGQPTVYPYTDGKIYDASFTNTRQSFNWTLTPIGQKRLYRVTMTGGTWKAYLDGVLQTTVTGLTFGLATAPKVTDSWTTGTIYELFVRTVISDATETADLITYFNTEHGMSVAGGSSGVPTTTATLPFSIGMTAAAAALLTTTAVLPLSVGLPTQATTVLTTTATLPISIGFSGQAAADFTTIATLPITVGMDVQAQSLAEAVTTSDLPISIGMTVTGFQGNPLTPWTQDVSQRALLEFVGVDSTMQVEPALAEPPPSLVVRPIMRHSIVMDPPTLDAQHRARVDSDYTVTGGVVGVPHVVVSGKDVTYFRDAPTKFGTITRAQPFGDGTFSVEFPQIGSLEETGTGELGWLKPGAPVEVFIANGSVRYYRFAGHLMSQDTGNGDTEASQTWQAQGALYQADLIGHRVPAVLPPTDIGTLIAKDLNGVTSRRYAPIKPVTTAIPSRQRGSLDDKALDYCAMLLSTAWLEDGETQWTVARSGRPRSYRITVKDRTTVHWTLTTGAPGVTTALSRDLTGTVNVIYGRGVASDGYSWAGWAYPGLLADDAPPYPFESAGTVITIGTTGSGVTTWQRRARELGHRLVVDGVYNSSDATVARAIQRDYGLLVDGIVGPQTWAATFDVGAAGGNLNAVRLPLAYLTQVEPRRRAANGADVGPNPNYDRTMLRIERDVDYGAGVTKAEARRSARAELARESTVAWSGTITLSTDPREGSRYFINEGQNIQLLGFAGEDLLLHVVSVEENYQDGTVTLTVDEHARDAMTLAAIHARDRDSAPDPARRPGNVNRRSRQTQDTITEFDGESGAGIIPRHALYGGLWTVIRIPVSQLGRIAKLRLDTSPNCEFAIALFGNRVTPAHLVRYVGNPSTAENPWDANASVLIDRFGLIEAWGQSGQMAGHSPGSGEGPLTGALEDTGGLEYVSAKPPWVWVAEYSTTSTFIEGRIYPATNT